MCFTYFVDLHTVDSNSSHVNCSEEYLFCARSKYLLPLSTNSPSAVFVGPCINRIFTVHRCSL